MSLSAAHKVNAFSTFHEGQQDHSGYNRGYPVAQALPLEFIERCIVSNSLEHGTSNRRSTKESTATALPLLYLHVQHRTVIATFQFEGQTWRYKRPW